MRCLRLTPGRQERGSAVGYWSFWLQLAGMFGMTLSFATAGIGQVYLERIMGIGYLETQLKIQVHFLMLMADGFRFCRGRWAVHLRFLPARAAFHSGSAAESRAQAAPLRKPV